MTRQVRPRGVVAATLFLAVYGAYSIWSVIGVPSTVRPPTEVWGLRLVGVACIVTATCLWRRIVWGRYIAYAVAAVTIDGWVAMTVWV